MTQFYFCLNRATSPTHANLVRHLQNRGWKSSRFNWRAQFTDNHLKFDQSVSEQLEFKHLLAQLVQRFCPEVMPLTYCINDNNWPMILGKLMKEEQSIWILKPALLNNGQGIYLFQTVDEIEQHYSHSKRMGGEHVLQRYITNPQLIPGLNGHKYSIRMFVVLTNYGGAYLYTRGYFNVALMPFTAHQFADLRPHLTNEHLQNDEVNVVQIPTERFEFFPQIYPQIKTIIKEVLDGLKTLFPRVFIQQDKPRLAIFGFDFMRDSDDRLWLLEANHGPCFPIEDDHPLQKHLYYEFWQDFINSFVEPLIKGTLLADYRGFERVG